MIYFLNDVTVMDISLQITLTKQFVPEMLHMLADSTDCSTLDTARMVEQRK